MTDHTAWVVATSCVVDGRTLFVEFADTETEALARFAKRTPGGHPVAAVARPATQFEVWSWHPPATNARYT